MSCQGGVGPVHRRHRLRLRVAGVVLVVAAAVAQVDPAEERDVELGTAGMAQHEELLVVRAVGPDPHVQQALPAGRLDRPRRDGVLLGRELQRRRAASARAARGRPPRAGPPAPGPSAIAGVRPRRQPLVGVHRASPANITRSPARSPCRRGEQLGEVVGAVHERPHPVAARSRPDGPGAASPAGSRGCPARSRRGTSRQGAQQDAYPLGGRAGKSAAAGGARADGETGPRCCPALASRPPAAGLRRGRAGRGWCSRGAGRPGPAPGGGCPGLPGAEATAPGAPGPARSGAAGARVRRVGVRAGR